MLGGPIIAGATLSRFFALHVFIIPGLLIAFVSVHLLLVLKLGINEWPVPGRVVRRATYIKEYHELTKKDGIPFFPGAVWKDLFFGGVILLSIAACALYFGPFGPSGPPDPTIIPVTGGKRFVPQSTLPEICGPQIEQSRNKSEPRYRLDPASLIW